MMFKFASIIFLRLPLPIDKFDYWLWMYIIVDFLFVTAFIVVIF